MDIWSFHVVDILIVVFWIIPYIVAGGYQRFGGTCPLIPLPWRWN
jgi:hypothetical protein